MKHVPQQHLRKHGAVSGIRKFVPRTNFSYGLQVIASKAPRFLAATRYQLFNYDSNVQSRYKTSS